MTTFKKILCPVDFSEPSLRALDYLAGQRGTLFKLGATEIIVLHVIPSFEPRDATTPYDLVLEEVSRKKVLDSSLLHVEKLIRFHHNKFGNVKILVRNGEPREQVLQTLLKEKCDLAVMGTHGITGWRYLVLGSTTEGVVCESPCPVLVVCAGPHAQRKIEQTLQTILCPTDFSEPSKTALCLAGSLARDTGAQLRVLHVLEALEPELGIVSPKEFNDMRSSDAAQALIPILKETLPPELQNGENLFRLVSAGIPAPEIVKSAKEVEADLIVIASCGQSGWRRFIFGSVADEVMRTAPCPVLVVPSSPLATSSTETDERHF